MGDQRMVRSKCGRLPKRRNRELAAVRVALDQAEEVP
jgi:hypothetical protein